jgi:hypothetical protein
MQWIFRAGGAEPAQSADALVLIADLERRIGTRLPATLCQLLSLANGEELLARFSHCDDPIPFSETNVRSKLLLWSQEGACDWFISPLPDAPLKEVLDELSGISGLIESLHGSDAEHEAFLRKWKAGAWAP